MLLGEVRQIIRERGVAAVSIREVARRAHVSHAAPAHHFGNKSGLVTAFAAEGFDRLASCVTAHIAASAASTPPAVLEAMGRAYVRFALDNPEHFGVMFAGELVEWTEPVYVRASRSAFRPLVDVVSRAAAEGYLTEEPIIVVAAAWSLVHGFSSLWLSGRLQDRAGMSDAGEMAARIARLFVSSTMQQVPAGGTATRPQVTRRRSRVARKPR